MSETSAAAEGPEASKTADADASSEAEARTPTSEPYTYTVRIFAGDKGTVDGGDVLVEEGIVPGTEKIYRWQDFARSNDSKYHPTGIRESGMDNSTRSQYVNAFTVDRDMDLVVSYGISGTEAKYTVRYLEEGTDRILHAPDEYYGTVGEKPVAAYRHIEGYTPRYRNMTGTLDKDDSKNEWTFYYIANTAPASGDTGSSSGTGRTGTTRRTGSATGNTGRNSGSTANNSAGGSASNNANGNTANNAGNAAGNSNANNAGANNGAGSGNAGNAAGTANATGGANAGNAAGNAAAGDAGAAGNAAGTGGNAPGNAAAGNDTGTSAGNGTGTADAGTQGDLYDIDEQGVPTAEFEGSQDGAAGATSEAANPELEGEVRAHGLPAAAKAGIGAAVIAVLAALSFYLFRRSSSEEDEEDEDA